MQKKLLVICGPTATGKTSLALSLAKKFNGEIVSSDSRQVYKEMDIGTGKDIPVGFEFRSSNLEIKDFNIGYFADGLIRLWGYDLVEPNEEFSVNHYVKIAEKAIEDIWRRNKLPILVGGTGLYIRGVVDGIPSISVPKDEKLRIFLKRKGRHELLDILMKLDPVKVALMNNSDLNNPRRLIRAIEVAQSNDKNATMIRTIVAKSAILFIGLNTSKAILFRRIEKRVQRRIKKGIENEIGKLLQKGISWENQSMQSIGYRQWENYFKSLKGFDQDVCVAEKQEAINKWIQEEKKYTKRQFTWFRKQKGIVWFNISNPEYKQRVEKLVNKWHNKPDI